MQSSNVADFFSPTVGSETSILLLQNLREQVEKAEVVLSNEDQLVLLENVGHTNSNIREECLLLLASTSRRLGRLAALARLLDSFEPMRILALEVLEECGEPQDQYAVEFVLQTDSEWAVRASAVSCLAGVADTEGKTAVIRALDDTHPSVRRYAASALARIADASDVAILLRAEAYETEPGARTGIYGALYQLGNFTYLEKLIGLLNIETTDPDLVNVNCQVLSALGTFVFPSDVPFVWSKIEGLDVSKAHPAVRARIIRLLEVLEEPN